MRRLPNLFEKSYQIFFRETPGDGARQFVSSLRWSVLGFGVGNGLLFAGIVIAGRLLGPAQFGSFAYVFAMAQVFVILLTLGMETAVMRELAQRVAGSPSSRVVIVSSGLGIVLLAAALLGIMIAGGFSLFGSRMGWDARVFGLAYFLAFALGVKIFFEAVWRAEGRFAAQAKLRVLEGASVIVIFLLLAGWFEWKSFMALGIALALGTGLSAVVMYGATMHRLIAWRAWDRQVALRLWRYIRYGLLSAAGGVMMFVVDRFLIERNLGIEELGIYAAYFAVSVQVASQLSQIFGNVFFPAAARHPRKHQVLRRLDRFVRLGFGPAWVAMGLLAAGGIFLFSSEYPLLPGLIVLMSLYGLCFFVWQLYWWFIASTGRRGVQFIGIHGLIAGGLYVGLVSWLLPRIGAYAPPAAFLATSVYLAAVIYDWRRTFREAITHV